MVDELLDVGRTLRRRPGRAILTAFAVVVGVASFVGTVGVSSSGATAVSRSFDRLAASEVTFHVDAVGDPVWFGRTVEARLADYPDVEASGVLVEGVAGGGARPLSRQPGGDADASVSLDAADVGYLEAVEAVVTPGSAAFDAANGLANANEALIGQAVLSELGDRAPSVGSTVYVGGVALHIGGVIRRADRDPRLLSAIVIPLRMAADLTPADPVTVQGFVRTTVGRSQSTADVMAAALLPERPGEVVVGSSLDVDDLRSRVVTQVDSLAVGLGVIALAVAAIGIMNASLVAVFERTAELGLRRCLGATRWQIARVVALEAVVVSSGGAVVGAAVGTIGTAVAVRWRHWPFVPAPRLIAVAVLAGALSGLVGGAYPALRSARISPMAAARS